VHPVLFHVGAVVIPSYGAVTALGVVLALLLAQHTARIVGLNPSHIWNLCVIALFAAMVGSRLFLLLMNWRVLLRHPSWIFMLAMIHHPLVGAAGAVAGVLFAWIYARWQKLPVLSVADAVAAPLALGLAFEQIGELLSGSGYGVEAGAKLPWAVTYTNPLAARWSGTPLGVPLHPVQAYAALGFLTLAILLVMVMPWLKQRGDDAGLWMMGTGVTVYVTELWRDRDGRGSVLGGVLDGPQIAAIVLVVAATFMLRERRFTRSRDEAGAGNEGSAGMGKVNDAARSEK
jgi:phosphatidylglycerol---prolipoprotein diacylglyceryl transferase